MLLNPYINFRDQAREAMEFYRTVFGGELTVTTFSDFNFAQTPEDEDLVMHAQLTTDDGFTLMASDTPSHVAGATPAGFAVSVSGDDESKLENIWNGLSTEGTVNEPFETPPWGGRFGMLTDKFGIEWMISANVTSDGS
ncbi:PhnB protein [Microbacterium endophyticum]|uniref:PhnB protein n=1 Tax=Microbacterium endophyticum TaxID=1526412 RepID=A0A7W4V4B9_9MICO|nr:VOC family protein [Microbacterium endophyticum]MBB2975948.1 PhnB protein [Microbacterium endophyticum]NIK37683.1 PhnB protein [Microbacterium endophyticum]